MIALRMLQSRYLSVMEATTQADFRNQVIRFSRQLGFQTVNAMVVIDHSMSNTEFQNTGNIPSDFLESHENIELGRRDPVMQHCKRTSIPIIWNQDTYVSRGESALWEQQAAYGIKSGIALAMHMPDASHFFIGVDRDCPISENAKSLTRIVADLQLFAVHAQEAAFKIFAPQLRADVESPHLTARELEALRWTMDGKRAWEVGVALNISERTAVFHLQNAVRKLGCTNKHQAVLKAIRMKLLQ